MKGKNRAVITTDMIADVLEIVYKDSGDDGHSGWDAKWKDVSTSYCGILRSDVIFLVKQCQVCAENPSKRPKGSAATMLQFQQTNDEFVDFLNTGDVQYDNSALDVPENDKHRGESFLENSARSLEQRTDFASGIGT
jgi:hypothetical protein